MKSFAGGGVPNGKGKKTINMYCRCCVAQNFKEKERLKEAEREIRKVNIYDKTYEEISHEDEN